MYARLTGQKHTGKKSHDQKSHHKDYGSRARFMMDFKVCGSPASRQGSRHVALQSDLRLPSFHFVILARKKKKEKKKNNKGREKKDSEV